MLSTRLPNQFWMCGVVANWWRGVVASPGQGMSTQGTVTFPAQSLRVPIARAGFTPKVPRANSPRQFWCGTTLTFPLVITSGRSIPPPCV